MVISRRIPTPDPRLLIGLLLVAASVTGVVLLISAADRTVGVLSAREPLSPGERVHRDDLVVVDVRLAQATERYLTVDDIPAEGIVVTRTIGAGELVPVGAVGRADGLRLASLVLEVGGALAASVQPGAPVDVWAARQLEGGRFGAPSVIVGGATVVRLVDSQSIVSGGETTAVEVLVPVSRVARVLDAVANADAVSLVPAAIPVR